MVEGEREFSGPLIRALILFIWVHLPKAPPPDTITVGVRISTYEWTEDGRKHSVYSCDSLAFDWANKINCDAVAEM